MPKKHSVVRDELEVKGTGLYCLFPYERLDRHKKGVFKIGLSTKPLNKRIENYHTYFPNGVYIMALLENPRLPLSLRNIKKMTIKEQYLKIEKFIFNYVTENGGERLYSSTRVKNQNSKKQGETEFVYCTEEIIQDAFTQTNKKFGGNLHLFYLDGLNPDTGKMELLADKAKENENKKPNYVGKIVFHT